jgi:hypothetical protein
MANFCFVLKLLVVLFLINNPSHITALYFFLLIRISQENKKHTHTRDRIEERYIYRESNLLKIKELAFATRYFLPYFVF